MSKKLLLFYILFLKIAKELHQITYKKIPFYNIELFDFLI